MSIVEVTAARFASETLDGGSSPKSVCVLAGGPARGPEGWNVIKVKGDEVWVVYFVRVDVGSGGERVSG